MSEIDGSVNIGAEQSYYMRGDTQRLVKTNGELRQVLNKGISLIPVTFERAVNLLKTENEEVNRLSFLKKKKAQNLAKRNRKRNGGK